MDHLFNFFCQLNQQRMLIWILTIFCSSCMADFSYPNFNQTHSLVLNKDAAIIITCNQSNNTLHYDHNNSILGYEYDNNNENPSNSIPKGEEEESMLQQYQEQNGMQTKKITLTNRNYNTSFLTQNLESNFGDRIDLDEVDRRKAYNDCNARLRLTPSAPSKRGSVWYRKLLPVVKGFNTSFSFQVSEHSKVCSYHVDPGFSLKHHKSCAVHGGDGFAFVIHRDSVVDSSSFKKDYDGEGYTAIGKDGDSLGYGGIFNSLAVEFDMWTNVPSQGSDDIFYDHISIHSSGSLSANSPGEKTSLGYARAVDLADGKIHVVQIAYFPYFVEEYINKMSANENLLSYLKDNGEGRRLGTLAIFIDDGLETGIPILAIPLNLSVLLKLPEDLAYVGFTASTGSKWENHDILQWNWCDSIHCNK